MNLKNITAPYIDSLKDTCKKYPEVNNVTIKKQLILISELMNCIKEQGDDEFRSVWFSVERGKIEDFGDFNEYLEDGEVRNEKEFIELWHFYYPDEIIWYNFAVAKYSNVNYYYIDSKLILQVNLNENVSEIFNDFQLEFTECLLKLTQDTINLIKNNIEEYNGSINANLPYKKRTGRILRSDYWSIFPDELLDFKNAITPEVSEILKKVKVQSESKTFKHLPTFNSGDFFRFCEIGYDSNNYFEKSNKSLYSKEKYLKMADGRDCGLRMLNENSNQDFLKWYETGKNCGGHPWEICRGGNSTHISLFVCLDENGWYLRLEGYSESRVIETIKMAVAFYKNRIPFILGKAEEIYKMAHGIDYIGILPETVIPRYCHGFFPAEDKINCFMNLGTERNHGIIKKAFWYPLPELQLVKKL